MKKKVILISGCSNGIGKDLSEYYQKNGFIVVGFGASVKIKSKKNLFYDIVNLNSKNQIKSFINLIIKKYKKIDDFINNAAAAPAAFPALLNNFEFTEGAYEEMGEHVVNSLYEYMVLVEEEQRQKQIKQLEAKKHNKATAKKSE